MASVTLRDIEKRYGDVTVVHGMNVEVADGELLVLVGPSGCGKSTTLRMVAGLETITAGELHIGERLVNDVSPRDRDIAMVFQSYALYPHMTVYENMAFGLKIRKMAKADIDARVRAAATLLGLSELLERRPKALSGGQRQRVAMGRAVVREPSVFLFDEPLSNLDAKLRVQMRLEIARLHKRLAATILYVTHDQVEAMTLADRIAVMHGGFLQQCDTPDVVYTRPANTFVATFIGSPAMNLWPVDFEPDGDGATLVGPGLRVALRAAHAGPLIEALGDARSCTLGLRPQDVQVVAEADADAQLAIDVVEPLGAETFVYGQLAGGDPADAAVPVDAVTADRQQAPVVLRIDPSTAVVAGALLPIRMPIDRIHLFDSAGLRLDVAATP